ncbi:MarR family winged helix-turn-helix transcriptional regulator [Arthrobacter sp. zg-Y1171]|uniref:MarR family winged helix-turn-helix transcriptional regulator n=1 Tax=unclassified Arthrobacter TaxID=235627 RepID=UPI002107994A|nr:MarR family transcriptional regulator [Arthrobacter sp. zg-Y1171]MCQ1945348.1 MarR family transcriptional regulator [Arthrobacter sp. zg-Y1116]MCQ1985294.1 MarR family transcriptional regulator [Arthrobacter sp. zg-Y844]MCQ1994991.1 MarR family transcriptional regulator [Arthrobacter sp. zg-Y1171]UWX80955.1 MarR family transcriptional regulator [Arthrobacter sp. zg-Y1171]
MATPLPRDPIADARGNWERHGWSDVAAPMAAITAIMRTQQILLARIEGVLKPFGLTFARYELLTLLSFARSGALPMNKASALLQVHPTSVTNAVDRLQDAELVIRSPHPTDGRTTLIELTPEGRTLAKQATLALNSAVFAQSGFGEQDVDQLIQILGSFRRNAGDFSD